MRIKESKPPELFIRNKAQALWESEIKDIAALQMITSGAVLVALDTELSSQYTEHGRKPCQDVSEIGIAVLPLHGPLVRTWDGIKQLYYQAGAETFTIRIRERRLPRRGKPLGKLIRSQPENVENVIKRILSGYKARRILVGYDLYHEFKFLLEECPAIVPLFTGWLDVQGFVQQRCGQLFSEPPSAGLPGLSNTLKAMGARDKRRFSNNHFAADDALRSLVVLCGLASNPTLLSDMVSKLPMLKPVECLSSLNTSWKQYPHVARISTVDEGKLPPWSPRAVVNCFAPNYTAIRAVALNWRKAKDKREGVRFWQLAFHTAEARDVFIAEVNGSSLVRTKLFVYKHQCKGRPSVDEIEASISKQQSKRTLYEKQTEEEILELWGSTMMRETFA